jgi:beta-1,4-mannosyl-glycoprotein beta-1,4-N-acetylglucosaminyltransferase
LARVFDVFPFFNEIDLLEVRLNELDDLVDFFVITEASTTFSGLEKPYYFETYQEKFKKFESKIIYQKIPNVPEHLGPFERDWFQRDEAKELLEKYITKEDFIIYGDLDEIPRSSAIQDAIGQLKDDTKIAHLAMDLYYYYLNLMEVSGTLPSYTGEYPGIRKKKWLGTSISKWEYASSFTMTQLRNPEHKECGVRISDGGWHFSYIGGHEVEPPINRILRKIEGAAHQEFNNPKIVKKITKRLRKNKDVFGRRRSKFVKLPDTNHLPEFIQKNLSKYQHLILP